MDGELNQLGEMLKEFISDVEGNFGGDAVQPYIQILKGVLNGIDIADGC